MKANHMNKTLTSSLAALALAAPLAFAPQAQARTCYSWDTSSYCIEQLRASVNTTKANVPVASSWRIVVPQGQYFTEAERNAVARITEYVNGKPVRATSARSKIDHVCNAASPGFIGCSNGLTGWVNSEIRAEEHDSHLRWYDTAAGKAYFDTRIDSERRIDATRAAAARNCQHVSNNGAKYRFCMASQGY